MMHAQPLTQDWQHCPPPDDAAVWDEAIENGDDASDAQTRAPLPSRGRPARGDSINTADTESTLRALIERMVDRDERALAALYDATSARVHGLVLRMTRRPTVAEEVVEDTFWQAWRQAPRFDAGRGKVITWLLAMARSRAIDALRRDGRFQHDDLPEEDEPQPADEQALPAGELLDALRIESRVHAAVAMLDSRARQLIALAFFKGLTHDEIALHTAMPLGSVKSLIRRSLQQLRHQLDDLGAA